MLGESDKRLAEEFRQLLLKSGGPLARLIVYGSRARGAAGTESDLDTLMVVECLDPEIRAQVSLCAWQVGFKHESVVSAMVMTVEEVEESPERSSPFMLAVNEDGVRI